MHNWTNSIRGPGPEPMLIEKFACIYTFRTVHLSLVALTPPPVGKDIYFGVGHNLFYMYISSKTNAFPSLRDSPFGTSRPYSLLRISITVTHT